VNSSGGWTQSQLEFVSEQDLIVKVIEIGIIGGTKEGSKVTRDSRNRRGGWIYARGWSFTLGAKSATRSIFL
jgi:hypothetical protein